MLTSVHEDVTVIIEAFCGVIPSVSLARNAAVKPLTSSATSTASANAKLIRSAGDG